MILAVAIITVAEIGEYKLIERIHSRVPPPPASIVVGIGDDAAVIEPDRGMLTVVTTDAIVGGRALRTSSYPTGCDRL